MLERDEVLVLQFQPEQPAGVVAEPLDHHRAAYEPLGGPPLHIGHLAADQGEPSGRGDQRGDRVSGGGHRLADPDRQRDRSAHGGATRLFGRHRVLGRHSGTAEFDSRGAGEPLKPRS